MLSRREVLLLGSAGLLAGCAATPDRPARKDVPVTPTPRHIAYGSDASQFGELSVPTSSIHRGTIVIIHGGFWLSQYTLSLGRPLAADLVARGYTCWNLEYRRVGNGGGWPTTLQDVAAGIDHLATLDVDASKIVLVGHSAGGQLAVWAAGRPGLPPGAPGAAPKVGVSGVVSQAGVLDMVTAADTGVGDGAESDFLGGSPSAVPARYEIADPIQRLPIAAPVLCVHARADANVPFAQSTSYVAAATKTGDRAALHEVPGDHFTLIDPSSKAWAVARAALPALLDGRLPS